ncbi:hypothetical protein BDU57DRAFT_530974 [Ampelomyces quisqualis]|uniref:Uncharacterized protein n=1 Tax=Ampelomyces quisqualis TaxID=50730 RepID=A0A6A5QFN4_AMPQU|nr:hypothetical protein BDU57DRAFT_530974 [Ampelomyces quisqualis]
MPGSRRDQRLIEIFGDQKMIESPEDARHVDKDDAEYLDTVYSEHDFTGMDRATLEKELCASLKNEEANRLRIYQLEQENANLKGFQIRQQQQIIARFQADLTPTVNITTPAVNITNHYHSSAPAASPAPAALSPSVPPAQVPVVDFGSLALRPRITPRVRTPGQTAVSKKPQPPHFRTICRRRICKRKACSLVHEDQRELYQELIVTLPESS